MSKFEIGNVSLLYVNAVQGLEGKINHNPIHGGCFEVLFFFFLVLWPHHLLEYRFFGYSSSLIWKKNKAE